MHQTYNILCGNSKLMDKMEISGKYPEILMNVRSLEEEGKTVVVLVIDEVPQLIISLEEEHLSKPEAQ